MDDKWQAQFDYNATTQLPNHQKSCWSKAGFQERFALFPVLLSKLQSSLNLNSAVDVGCGPGDYSRVLKNTGLHVTGVDYAPHVVKLAQKSHPDIQFQEANNYALPFKDQSVDLVISIGVLQCLEDYKQAIKELCRVSKKAVLLSTLRATSREDPDITLQKVYPYDPMPARLYHPDIIKKLIEKEGFSAELVFDTLDGSPLSDCFFLLAKRK